MNKNISMLILSCDKFSDLWDGHVKLLEQNWPDRNINTYIVTDAQTTKKYPGIEIISAGPDLEWTERLAYALERINTEYVFITLDDYFLIKRVNNQSMVDLVTMMKQEGFDYLRLFKRPKKATLKENKSYKKIYFIDTSKKYSVNLYAGIWNIAFLKSTLTPPKNVWQYEVSLSLRAQEYRAKCVVSLRNEFQILDVVRKGKLLHRASKFFRTHPDIYKGCREVNSWEYEIKLFIQTMAGRHLPNFIRIKVKDYMRKRGHKFFSDY